MAPMKKLAPSKVFVTDRDPKGQKFVSIVVSAYNKAKLSDGPDGEAQRINDTPGLAELVGNFIKTNRFPNKFKKEEVLSKYGYFSGYKPKGLTEQCNRLQVLFCGLGYANVDLLQQIEGGKVGLPKMLKQDGWAWFATPNWMKNPKIFGLTYSEAVQKVLGVIKKTRNGDFVNYREGQIDEKHLRQSACTQRFWKELSEDQGNPDILIISAQFGIRHRGRSVRRAHEVFLINEFGLGAFAVGTMLLTHPERLMHHDDLYIDCIDDEFDVPVSDVRFDRSPCFVFRDGEVKFDTRYTCGVNSRCGSASGLVSQ
jgi:hypothetical protein